MLRTLGSGLNANPIAVTSSTSSAVTPIVAPSSNANHPFIRITVLTREQFLASYYHKKSVHCKRASSYLVVTHGEQCSDGACRILAAQCVPLILDPSVKIGNRFDVRAILNQEVFINTPLAQSVRFLSGGTKNHASIEVPTSHGVLRFGLNVTGEIQLKVVPEKIALKLETQGVVSNLCDYQASVLEVNAKSFLNESGCFLSADTMTLRCQEAVVNDGSGVMEAKNLTVSVASRIRNGKLAKIAAHNHLVLSAELISNAGAINSNRNIEITARALNNQMGAWCIAEEQITLHQALILENDGILKGKTAFHTELPVTFKNSCTGQVLTEGTLQLRLKDVSQNEGVIEADILKLKALDSFKNVGQLTGHTFLAFKGQKNLDNLGKICAERAHIKTLGDFNNLQDILVKDLMIQSKKLCNRGKVIARAAIFKRTEGRLGDVTLDNRGGYIEVEKQGHLEQGGVQNGDLIYTQGGRIQADMLTGTLTGALQNQRGSVVARHRMALDIRGDLNTDQGHLFQTENHEPKAPASFFRSIIGVAMPSDPLNPPLESAASQQNGYTEPERAQIDALITQIRTARFALKAQVARLTEEEQAKRLALQKTLIESEAAVNQARIKRIRARRFETLPLEQVPQVLRDNWSEAQAAYTAATLETVEHVIQKQVLPQKQAIEVHRAALQKLKSADRSHALLLSHPDFLDLEGYAPLHRAVLSQDVLQVKKLLSSGMNPDIFTRFGYTALHLAARHGDIDSVRVLLEYRANVALKVTQGLDAGCTAQAFANRTNHPEIVELLTAKSGDQSEELPHGIWILTHGKITCSGMGQILAEKGTVELIGVQTEEAAPSLWVEETSHIYGAMGTKIQGFLQVNLQSLLRGSLLKLQADRVYLSGGVLNSGPFHTSHAMDITQTQGQLALQHLWVGGYITVQAPDIENQAVFKATNGIRVRPMHRFVNRRVMQTKGTVIQDTGQAFLNANGIIITQSLELSEVPRIEFHGSMVIDTMPIACATPQALPTLPLYEWQAVAELPCAESMKLGVIEVTREGEQLAYRLRNSEDQLIQGRLPIPLAVLESLHVLLETQLTQTALEQLKPYLIDRLARRGHLLGLFAKTVVLQLSEGGVVDKSFQVSGSLHYEVAADAIEPLIILADQKALQSFDVSSPTAVVIGNEHQYVHLGGDPENACQTVRIQAENIDIRQGRLAAFQAIRLKSQVDMRLGRTPNDSQRNSGLLSGGLIEMHSARNIFWDHLDVYALGDFRASAEDLDNLSSQIVIKGDAFIDAPSCHRLLYEKKNLGGKRVPWGDPYAMEAYGLLYAQHRALSQPAYFEVGGKLTIVKPMAVVASKVYCEAFEGPTPILESFIPYNSWVCWGLFGNPRKPWWGGGHLQESRGVPIEAIFSVNTPFRSKAPMLAIEGILSAPRIEIDGITTGHIGWDAALEVRLPPAKRVQFYLPFIEQIKPSSLFELTKQACHETVYRPMLAFPIHNFGPMIVQDAHGKLRANIHRYRCLFSPWQEMLALRKTCLEVLKKGAFNQTLVSAEAMLTELRQNTDDWLRRTDGALITEALDIPDPMVVYREMEFVHESGEKETVLAPGVYIPKRLDNPRLRDWAGGLFSQSDILLEGDASSRGALGVTGHIEGESVKFSRFKALTHQRRVAKEIQVVVDTVTTSSCFGLKEKTQTHAHQITTYHAEPGNTITASRGIEFENIKHLKLSGVRIKAGIEGVRTNQVFIIEERAVVETTLQPVSYEHRGLLGGSEGIQHKIEPQVQHAVIESQGPVALHSQVGHYDTMQVKGQASIQADQLHWHVFLKQLESEQRAQEAQEQEARRTRKRKKRQAIAKAAIAVVAAPIAGHYAGVMVFGGAGVVPVTLGQIMFQGAVSGGVSSLITGQNVGRGIFQGGLLAGIGHQIGDHLQGFESLAGHDYVIRGLQTAATASVSTVLNGGPVLENTVIQVGANAIGHAVVGGDSAGFSLTQAIVCEAVTSAVASAAHGAEIGDIGIAAGLGALGGMASFSVARAAVRRRRQGQPEGRQMQGQESALPPKKKHKPVNRRPAQRPYPRVHPELAPAVASAVKQAEVELRARNIHLPTERIQEAFTRNPLLQGEPERVQRNLAQLGEKHGSQGGWGDAIKRGAAIVFTKTLDFLVGTAHASESDVFSERKDYTCELSKINEMVHSVMFASYRKSLTQNPKQELEAAITQQTLQKWMPFYGQKTGKQRLLVQVLGGSIGHVRMGMCDTNNKAEYYGFGSDIDSRDVIKNAVNRGKKHAVLSERSAAHQGRMAITKEFILTDEKAVVVRESLERDKKTEFYYKYNCTCKTYVGRKLREFAIADSVDDVFSKNEIDSIVTLPLFKRVK